MGSFLTAQSYESLVSITPPYTCSCSKFSVQFLSVHAKSTVWHRTSTKTTKDLNSSTISTFNPSTISTPQQFQPLLQQDMSDLGIIDLEKVTVWFSQLFLCLVRVDILVSHFLCMVRSSNLVNHFSMYGKG